jgi:hypothetical protein
MITWGLRANQFQLVHEERIVSNPWLAKQFADQRRRMVLHLVIQQ